MSETLKQFTFYSEVFFFPLSSENNPLYFMLKLGLQLYIYSILIEHKQECLKSLRWTTTALHSICMFILPVRGPLFMDNWRTQIIIPSSEKSAFIICKVLQCLCVRSRCLLIACLLLQRFCWANGDLANSKRCQAFSSLFLSVTSLCIPLKHTDPCLVCSLGGTITRKKRLNTRCTRFDCVLWTCIKRKFLVLDTIRLHA